MAHLNHGRKKRIQPNPEYDDDDEDEKENIGNPYSLNLALHVNFPNYWFESSRIHWVHKNIPRMR